MKKVEGFLVMHDDISKLISKALDAKGQSDYWAQCAFNANQCIAEGGNEYNENDLKWYRRREQYYYGKYNALLDVLDMFGIDIIG